MLDVRALAASLAFTAAATIACLGSARVHEERAEREERRAPVSRYALRPLSADGRQMELRLWLDTPREYAVHLEAGRRSEVVAARDDDSRTARVDVVRVPFEKDGARVTLADGTRLRWETFDEVCVGGTMTSWRLCPEGAADERACAMAPATDRCFGGPLELVEVYRAGDTLWVVVERHMHDRVARMAGGAVLGG